MSFLFMYVYIYLFIYIWVFLFNDLCLLREMYLNFQCIYYIL